MRVYGRENGVWVTIQTDANGYNDYVYVTALIQCLKLNLNESPFWANWGIPAQQTIVTQIFPDFYVALIQQRYAQYFASLIITKVATDTTPTYNVKITTNQGAQIEASVAI